MTWARILVVYMMDSNYYIRDELTDLMRFIFLIYLFGVMYLHRGIFFFFSIGPWPYGPMDTSVAAAFSIHGMLL